MKPMKSQAELDRFLQSQHNQGQDEGEGAFVLDPVRARQQLGRFQLAQPGLYLVKAVQAAVMAGAELVVIKVSRRELTLEFSSEDPELISPQKISESLLAVHSLAETPLRHLVAAISGAVGSGVKSIAWHTPQGGLSVTESGVEHHSESHSKCCLKVEKKGPLMAWLRGTVFVDEIRAVDERCGWGPCAVVLDGRKVSPQGWGLFKADRSDSLGLWPKNAKSYRDFLQKNLLERHLASVGGTLVSPPKPASYRTGLEGDVLQQLPRAQQSTEPWMLWPEEIPGAAPSCSIAITTSLVGPARIAVIKHGALLETKQVAEWGHPGALVLFDGSGLVTDLTEFRVTENEDFHAAMKRLGALVEATAEGVSETLLDEIFEAGGLPLGQHAGKKAVWWHWLQNHALPESLSREALLDAFLPQQKVCRAPLPDTFENILRDAHAQHLPSDERILVAYSDALLGESADGFAATEERLCWKTAFFGPNYIHWDDAEAVDFHLAGNGLSIGGSTPSFTLNPHLALCMYGVLKSVEGLGTPSPRVGLVALRAQAIKALGKLPKLYYHPHIPLDKMTVAGAAFGQSVEIDEPVVVLYDNTLLGKCDNGVLLTLKRVAWRNLMEDPVSFLWEELSPTDIVKVADGARINVKDKDLHITQAQVRDGLWELITARCLGTA